MATRNSPECADQQNERLAVRPKEAARLLGICERHLFALTKAGVIPCFRLGRAKLYSIAVLENWAQEQSRPGGVL